MNDKPQSNPFTTPFAADFIQLFNASPLVEMQRRNMEAMSKSAAKLSEAMIAVASKHMSALSELGSARPAAESLNGPADVTGFFAAQMRNGRDAMERAIAEMRAANDTMRHCWYDVAHEFEACARENASSFEEQLKKSSAVQQTKTAGPALSAQPPRKAAAE